MKKIKIILIEIIVISSSLSAQTKMIALKSHSGVIFSKTTENADNFGNIRELPNEYEQQIQLLKIDSIQKISDTSYEEFSNHGSKTIITTKEIIADKKLVSLKEKYPSTIKIIGFDKQRKTIFKNKKSNNINNKKNSIHWLIAIIILAGITFSTVQIRNKNRSFEL